MSEARPSVAAVVVTFDRKHLVAECLAALLAQTVLPERIVLVDNGSSDGTAEHLRALGLLDSPLLDFLRIEVNQGGTSGFCAGIERALQGGCDWVWMMDDDAEPRPDALAELVRCFAAAARCSALACLVVDPAGAFVEHHSGRLNQRNPFGPLVVPVRPPPGAPWVEIDHAAFVGLCVRSAAVVAAGLPEKRFFIHVDDLEYCQRLRAVGPIWLVPASVIVHKEAAKTDRFVERRLGFLRAQRLRYESLWGQYFIRRNSVYFMKRHARSRLMLWAWLLVTFARSALGILAFDDHKWRRLRFVWSSIADGIGERFDNEKAKALLYD